jgi:hypothetical protein
LQRERTLSLQPFETARVRLLSEWLSRSHVVRWHPDLDAQKPAQPPRGRGSGTPWPSGGRALGPAGRVYSAFRALADRSDPFRPERLSAAATPSTRRTEAITLGASIVWSIVSPRCLL